MNNQIQQRHQTTIEKFSVQAKKMFSSCKFAFGNLHGNDGERKVWGEFTGKKQAKEAADLWMTSFREFKPKLEVRMSGKYTKVSVIF